MKKSILILSVSLVIIGGALYSCQSQSSKEVNASDKVQDNKNNLREAQGDSIKAQQDTVTTYQEFIQESEDRINEYEKNIAEIKTKIANEKVEERARYEKKLAELEQKNKTLKAEVIDYNNKQADNWGDTQVEFRKDLDELDSAISDFFVNN